MSLFFKPVFLALNRRRGDAHKPDRKTERLVNTAQQGSEILLSCPSFSNSGSRRVSVNGQQSNTRKKALIPIKLGGAHDRFGDMGILNHFALRKRVQSINKHKIQQTFYQNIEV